MHQYVCSYLYKRYGPAAGKMTENSLYSVGNLAISANNVKNLKIMRTLAKATAKETVGIDSAPKPRVTGGIQSSYSSSNLKQQPNLPDTDKK
jgi:hypothetical protein